MCSTVLWPQDHYLGFYTTEGADMNAQFLLFSLLIQAFSILTVYVMTKLNLNIVYEIKYFKIKDLLAVFIHLLLHVSSFFCFV